MRRTAPFLSGLALASLLAAGCSTPDSGVVALPTSAASTAAPPTTTAGGPDTTSATGPDETSATGTAPLGGREVLEAVGPSMAFVETPFGTGSGMVVADRYVVTNLHVVEPFGLAAVTVDGRRTPDVPVAGVDLARDLALLGPLDVDVPSLEPTSPDDLAVGDELYLIGYPGDVTATPEPTISRGILSQVRTLDDWDQTYLQTDAAIAGGQSGGALVDDEGRVVGISGLSFGEGNFALALSGADVSTAVDELAAGGGDVYRALPEEPSDSAGTISLAGPEGEQLAVLRNDGDDFVWRLRLDPAAAPVLWVTDDFGADLLLNDAAIARAAADSGTSPEEFTANLTYDRTASREVEPGVYEIAVPAGAYAIAYIGTDLPDGASMAYDSSVPLFVPPDEDETTTTTAVGGEVEGIVEYVESYDTVSVDLVAGEEVEVAVRSAVGDPLFELAAPGQTFDQGVFADDSEEGLYGLDAVTTYTPPTTGTYRIRIASADGLGMAWKLTVRRTP